MSILVFDVGGSSIKYAVMEEDGRFREQGAFRTPQNLKAFYEGLCHVKKTFSPTYEFQGAAFSLPGAVDDTAGIIGGASAVPYLHDFPIRTELSAQLGLPVSMENDANCAALGECWLGAAAGCQDVAFFVIGSGVGGALVKDGRIHHGRHLHGGEFGFMVMDDTGLILSTAASVRAMVERIEIGKGLQGGTLDGKQAFALASQGDETAKASIAQMMAHLARAIYNIQYAFDPECFVLGGAVSERNDFVPAIEQEMTRILDRVEIARIRPDIRQGRFGNDANLIGALRHFLQARG